MVVLGGQTFDGEAQGEHRGAVRPDPGPASPVRGEPNGRQHWPLCALRMLASVAALAAVGAFFALFYPIIEELRVEKVRGEDGTEERMLGVWSILMLSVSAGCITCAASWILTYVDSYSPGAGPSDGLSQASLRDISGHGHLLGYGVAILNGLMATLTVMWGLS